MDQADRVGADEVIIRRIPGRPDCKKEVRPSVFRATSFALQPRSVDKYPSWSRQSKTTPQCLLEIEHAKGREMVGWSVAALAVAKVRELGADVVADPTEEDPGHCLIVPTEGKPFSATLWSRLAKHTRIVYEWSR